MVRIRNEADDTTLFQFDTSTKMILNPSSLFAKGKFHTQRKKRYAKKDIIKRKTGITNIELHVKVAFIGASRETNAASLITVLSGNEFIFFDTEGHHAALDGVYAPNGEISQKEDKGKNQFILEFNLIEKED